MNNTKHYIYCLEFYETFNEMTGEHNKTKRYIGRTKNLKRRLKEHKDGNTRVLRHQNWEKCRCILTETGDEYNIKELHQKWIDHFGGLSNLLNNRNA